MFKVFLFFKQRGREFHDLISAYKGNILKSFKCNISIWKFNDLSKVPSSLKRFANDVVSMGIRGVAKAF